MPLGIELKSEQKLEEMVEIMDSLHKYVPTVSTEESVELAEATTKVTRDDFFPLLMGKYTCMCS